MSEKFKELMNSLFDKYKADPDGFSKNKKAAKALRVMADYIDKQSVGFNIDFVAVKDHWNSYMANDQKKYSKVRAFEKDSTIYKNVKVRCLKICAQSDLTSQEDLIGFLEGYYDLIHKSDWLSGRAGKFKCTFDWAFKPTNYQNIINGKYNNVEVKKDYTK